MGLVLCSKVLTLTKKGLAIDWLLGDDLGMFSLFTIYANNGSL